MTAQLKADPPKPGSSAAERAEERRRRDLERLAELRALIANDQDDEVTDASRPPSWSGRLTIAVRPKCGARQGTGSDVTSQ